VTKSSDADLNSEKISPGARDFLASIEWFDEIGSTSDYLMAQTAPAPGKSRVAIAKHQTAGRGRHGQQWHSSSTSSICLSMAHTFAREPDNLASVTLAVGASIVAALDDLGAEGVALKWPNDLMINDAKLGGILTERHQSKEECPTIVVGVGLNIDLRGDPQPFVGTSLNRAVGDLAVCFKHLPVFDDIANLLIYSLRSALVGFESRGFSAFKEEWQSFDWLRGKTVHIAVADQLSIGICEGIDSDGALLLNTPEGMQRITSGSVSVHDRPSGAVNSQ
jgi:BirA family biotin operon repressor/biotin-[acetyl-CoA-carboxylase] ligase